MGGKMDAINNQAPQNCCLCEEISSKAFPKQYQGAYPVTTRICVDTGEFVALPTLSPLFAGHILVLPYRHVSNLAALPLTSRLELLVCAQFVSKRLIEHFGAKLYFFEHGVSVSGMACGVDHAHLHIMPLSSNSERLVESQIETDYPAHDCADLGQILSLANQVQPAAYLLHGSALDSLRISFQDHIPSQYMRRLITDIDKRVEWDWKSLSGREEFFSTCNALQLA
jgi:diadenosine tetraphosphate (Ap4A) HIT family hydrolase